MSITEAELKKLKEIPVLKKLKKIYDENPQVQGSGRRKKMRGGNFWDDVGSWFKQAAVDVDAWAKKVKPLTALSKAAGLIGMIPGLNEVALLSPAIAGVAGFTGYGKKRGGAKKMPHMNPVAGQRGGRMAPRDMVGMGTMTQDYQSQVKRMLGGATFPSHLQPFLTSKTIKGNGVALAVGSIGNVGRIKV
jgi:hypothetical protein